jgi:8-oxo-dGTP diphosphatase
VSAALPLIDVACGVLVDADGQVLMAQRPPGKIAAGHWEFPGGKIEPGETTLAALSRELREELGVEVLAAEPLIDFVHRYRDRRVRLRTYRVTAYRGQPQGQEAQTLAWRPVTRLLELQPQLPTVAPIRAALQLPAHYAWTPAVVTPDRLPAADPRRLPSGSLIRLRQPGWSAAVYAAVAPAWVAAQRAAGWQPVLDDPALARALQTGVHLSEAAWRTCAQRPSPAEQCCLASVHAATPPEALHQLQLDAWVLGSVAPTPSHPGGETLGWPRFEALTRAMPVPVYALGGLGPQQLREARQHGAQGIAAIRGYFGG